MGVAEVDNCIHPALSGGIRLAAKLLQTYLQFENDSERSIGRKLRLEPWSHCTHTHETDLLYSLFEVLARNVDQQVIHLLIVQLQQPEGARCLRAI